MLCTFAVFLQADLYLILTEPVNNLIRQQVELLKAEGVELAFTDGAIREIARVAFVVSELPGYDSALLCKFLSKNVYVCAYVWSR